MALVLMGITGTLSLPAPKLTSIRHLLLSRVPACLQDLRVSGAHAPVDTGRPGDTQDSPQGEGRLGGGGHGAGPEGDRDLPGGVGAPEVSLQQVPPPRSPALTNLCPRGGGGPPGPTSETVPALTGGEELQGDRPADPRRAVPPGGH